MSFSYICIETIGKCENLIEKSKENTSPVNEFFLHLYEKYEYK